MHHTCLRTHASDFFFEKTVTTQRSFLNLLKFPSMCFDNRELRTSILKMAVLLVVILLDVAESDTSVLV